MRVFLSKPVQVANVLNYLEDKGDRKRVYIWGVAEVVWESIAIYYPPLKIIQIFSPRDPTQTWVKVGQGLPEPGQILHCILETGQSRIFDEFLPQSARTSREGNSVCGPKTSNEGTTANGFIFRLLGSESSSSDHCCKTLVWFWKASEL